ncbi:TPA: enterobactin synthase subunit EntD [Citrobacter freundii]|uniref:enterobactin synthase subunit EntD n=1 Tax=Citrobacter freundii TaxID=546 RepID=UPI00383BF3A3|nr:enterobactin synthase subunit EntD [Citrobacter freundii]HBM9256727.1 enterobactin synthase subunit EntD [Citrobacter freundii]
MHTTHTPLTFADHTLHIVEFDPDTFHEHDLFWLPHHTQLQSCGRKRKAEHLAGRIAAVHALREYGIKTVPGIGGQRQPLWPQKLFGSISHSTSTALAVVSTHPVGLDIEDIFTRQMASELVSSIVTNSEKEWLANSGLPVEQALTLAFSAKESAFKATLTAQQANAGFTQYQIVELQHNQMILRAHSQTYRVQWRFSGNDVITLATV